MLQLCHFITAVVPSFPIKAARSEALIGGFPKPSAPRAISRKHAPAYLAFCAGKKGRDPCSSIAIILQFPHSQLTKGKPKLCRRKDVPKAWLTRMNFDELGA